ncbi:MAG: trypsin-like peptidase domain-containing protein [Oscillospiraceae bacterium]|jgi:S1-C subfamily serine protease|nr:trypsin-like peptidase domain-containing protein [Oscillospiraceae bacterium]
MKKRVLATAIACALCLSLLGLTVSAASLSNIKRVRTYAAGTFTDVAQTDWFYGAVAGGYAYGYFDGRGDGTFDPQGSITLAELTKLAACLRSAYDDDGAAFAASSAEPWYAPYASYAERHAILTPGEYASLDAPATRSDAAQILSRALPEEAFAASNTVAAGTIPDVQPSYTYAPAVYQLYRAGILTGRDDNGAFYPNAYITRAEASAIVLRAADPAARLIAETRLSAERLFEKCSPAVFLMDIYNDAGKHTKSGSGFFVSPDGIAVTNCHVVADAAAALVTLSDGTEHVVAGVYFVDLATDFALIQIETSEEYGAFPYLNVRDSDSVRTGETVYTISSPLRLYNSISRGIVSGARRELDGTVYIQTDAAIAAGSSGGALFDETGSVIGIMSATMAGGSNMNLAVPISGLQILPPGEYLTFADFAKSLPYYKGYFPAPDFAKYSKRVLVTADLGSFYADYYYASLPSGQRDKLLEGYAALLEENHFTREYWPETWGPDEAAVFYNGYYGVTVMFGDTNYNGKTYFCVEVVSY